MEITEEYIEQMTQQYCQFPEGWEYEHYLTRENGGEERMNPNEW